MVKIAKKHIFFLDDEPMIHHAVKETLEEYNYQVSCFESPTNCLSRLRSEKCDLLITDLKMPEKDGIEVLVDVNQQAPEIPVLIITGYGDIPAAVKTMKTGAADIIEKPLSKKDFVRKIKSILKEKILFTQPESTYLSNIHCCFLLRPAF